MSWTRRGGKEGLWKNLILKIAERSVKDVAHHQTTKNVYQTTSERVLECDARVKESVYKKWEKWFRRIFLSLFIWRDDGRFRAAQRQLINSRFFFCSILILIFLLPSTEFDIEHIFSPLSWLNIFPKPADVSFLISRALLLLVCTCKGEMNGTFELTLDNTIGRWKKHNF